MQEKKKGRSETGHVIRHLQGGDGIPCKSGDLWVLKQELEKKNLQGNTKKKAEDEKRADYERNLLPLHSWRERRQMLGLLKLTLAKQRRPSGAKETAAGAAAPERRGRRTHPKKKKKNNIPLPIVKATEEGNIISWRPKPVHQSKKVRKGEKGAGS